MLSLESFSLLNFVCKKIKNKQSLQYFINNIFEKSLNSPKQVDSLFLIKHFFLKYAKAGKEKCVSIQQKNIQKQISSALTILYWF